MSDAAQPNAQNAYAGEGVVGRWIAAQAGWRAPALSAAAGAIATLGHAPFHIVPAFILGIALLVWQLDAAAASARPMRAAFARAYWFAAGHFISGTYWVSSAFLVDSQTWGPLWGAPAALALGGGLALFWGAAFAFGIKLWTRDWRRIGVFAGVAMIAEFTRGNVFGGFPWNLPGYVWPAGEPVSQLASIIGAYGLSALTLLLAAAAAPLADARPLPFRLGPALAACLGLGLAWGYGVQRMADGPILQPGETPIIRVADSGISQADKWERRPDQEWRVLSRYAAVSEPAEESRAQIVVWPEGAIPAVNFLLLENPDMLERIGAIMGDRALIVGFTRRARAENGDVHYFNSAAIIDGVSGRARLAQIYDKNRLVPFGEFIPLWSLVGRFNIAPLQQIGSGFTAGARPTRLIAPEAPSVVPLICYEAIFPGMVPRGEERPGWIVNLTNDAWFGAGTGPWQHYNMARYRAIEEGLPLARAASGGVSAIVDSYGRAIVETGLEGGGVEAQLPAALNEPVYGSWGRALAGLIVLLLLALRLAPAGLRSRGSKA
ncbi:MAG: apolipoprotein N-acyltransferase [Hyphomonadaceae bacterium]